MYKQCRWCGRTYDDDWSHSEFCGEKCKQEYFGQDAVSQANEAVAVLEEKLAKERKQREREHAELLATLERERQEREEERVRERKQHEEDLACERKQREEERALERQQREQERVREEERREEERKRDPRRWYGCEWVSHLSEHPEDVFQCDWQKLKGSDCAGLFSVQPDLVPKDVDWPSRMTGDDWERLLCAQPRFFGQCNWGRLSAGNWVKLLQCHPQVADKCKKWDEIDVDQWVGLVEKHPQFAEKCNWAELRKGASGESPSVGLRRVLERNPDIVNACDLSVLSADDWVELLIVRPKLAVKFDKWDDVSYGHWIKLLRKHPRWIKKCNCKKIGSDGLCKILQQFPDLINDLDLTVLGANDWALLLQVRPDWAAMFDKWSKIDDDAWVQLLLRRPQFIVHCEKLMNFSDDAIENLLLRHPEFADSLDVSKLNGNAIANLLSRHPNLAGRFCFSKLNDENWNKLLSNQPHFATKYQAWSDDPIADIVKMVTKHSALAEAFDWNRLGEDCRRSGPEIHCVSGIKVAEYRFPLCDKLEEKGVSKAAFIRFVKMMSIRAWSSLCAWDKYYAAAIKLTKKKINAATDKELCDFLVDFLCSTHQDLTDNNYIEDIIDASRLSVDNWAELLERAPDRYHAIILGKLKAKSIEFGPDQWAKVVRYYPGDYEKYCKDLVFGPTQWGVALSRNYDNEDFIKFWDSKGYSIEDWVDFLATFDGCGSARDRFNSMVDWGQMVKIPAEKWIRLVLADGQYAKKLNWEEFKEDPDVWRKLTPNEWVVLIVRWNDAIKYFHPDTFNWQEVFPANWVWLLESFPQFKEKCDISKVDWSWLSRDQMVRALCVCPDGLENYYKDWASLSHDQWKVLVEHKPALKSLMERYDNGKGAEKSKGDKKNDDKQKSKEKNAGCQLGCLGTLIKLVFWCAVIGFGLIFGWRLISRLIGS